MGFLRNLLIAVFIVCLSFLGSVSTVEAKSKLGMHVLRPEEFAQAAELFEPLRANQEQPLYITIPFGLDDIQQPDRWQAAFAVAKQKNIVPIVRLSTRFEAEHNSWKIPNRKDITDLSQALNRLDWPQEERYVILFNETNHAAEWGGRLDPHSFIEMSDFAADWLITENKNYRILPAALDLAAPNGPKTREALGYWQEALAHRPEFLTKISAWNSHSYPNPAFSAPPERKGKNSLTGFEHELAFVREHTDRELPIFITETGWWGENFTQRTLDRYYDFAVRNIWSDERIVTVTPFILAGSPGPFDNFSFLDQSGKPTRQWNALARALAEQQRRLLTSEETQQNPL